jgi:hypothetical protein
VRVILKSVFPRWCLPNGTLPVEVTVAPTISDAAITWARDRLDGAAGYLLRILLDLKVRVRTSNHVTEVALTSRFSRADQGLVYSRLFVMLMSRISD